MGLECLLECLQNFGHNVDAGVVAHHSDPPDLAGRGSQTSGYLNLVSLHAIASHGSPVDTVGDLDGGDGGQPRAGVGHEQLEAEVGEAGVEMVGTEPVSPPAVLQPLLRHQGEPLPQGVHGVDGPGVVVHTALVGPAVPVLAKPTQIEIKGTWRFGSSLESLDSSWTE